MLGVNLHGNLVYQSQPREVSREQAELCAFDIDFQEVDAGDVILVDQVTHRSSWRLRPKVRRSLERFLRRKNSASTDQRELGIDSISALVACCVQLDQIDEA